MPIVQDDVLNALKQCYDPEIPVNIVDLGLIYDIRFDAVPEGQQDVTVDMTLTAQGCPEHVNISAQVKSRVEQLPGVRNANVNIVWDPAWTPERLSPEARTPRGIDRYRRSQFADRLSLFANRCTRHCEQRTTNRDELVFPQLLKRPRRAPFRQLLDPAADLHCQIKKLSSLPHI